MQGNATRHWDAADTALSVETTAYALLAQMALGRLKYAGPIVTWLTSQRDPQGGFVSTQVRTMQNCLISCDRGTRCIPDLFGVKSGFHKRFKCKHD